MSEKHLNRVVYKYDEAMSNTMLKTLAIGHAYVHWQATEHKEFHKPQINPDNEPVMYMFDENGETQYRVRIIVERIEKQGE